MPQTFFLLFLHIIYINNNFSVLTLSLVVGIVKIFFSGGRRDMRGRGMLRRVKDKVRAGRRDMRGRADDEACEG